MHRTRTASHAPARLALATAAFAVLVFAELLRAVGARSATKRLWLAVQIDRRNAPPSELGRR